MAEKELNNTLLNLALRDNSSSKEHEFSGAKIVRVDSEGRLWIDFGNATEAPVQSITKSAINWEAISGTTKQYLPIEGVTSKDTSVHNRKSLMPRKYKIVGFKANARAATLGAGESVIIRVMDNTTETSVQVTLDENYVADTVETYSGNDYDMTTDYLAIQVDPTSIGVGSIQFLHIALELVPLEV